MNFTHLVTASGLAWQPRSADMRMATAIAQQHGISELLAGILAGRDVAIDAVAQFLNPTLRDFLPDPFHLLDMEKAVERLIAAMQNSEKIAVFGDYDVDGATSTALLMQYFSSLGVTLRPYIPDRMSEGYGPTIGGFKTLIDGGAKLIITVDCGTLAHAPIAYAVSRGVDVIVVDHHLSSGDLPAAYAVVNPNRVDETSEQRHLAAVGVTFLLLVALNKRLREKGFFQTRNGTESHFHVGYCGAGHSVRCDVHHGSQPCVCQPRFEGDGAAAQSRSFRAFRCRTHGRSTEYLSSRVSAGAAH